MFPLILMSTIFLPVRTNWLSQVHLPETVISFADNSFSLMITILIDFSRAAVAALVFISNRTSFSWKIIYFYHFPLMKRKNENYSD